MKRHTLYIATRIGRKRPQPLYFESRRERNAYVRAERWSVRGGTIRLTERDYNYWKTTGEFPGDI